MLLSDRIEVLAGPWDTGTVQTIAAFASLHVAVMVTICLVAEPMRLPVLIRVAAWTFLALTMVATIYLGWHFFVDVLAGVGVGAAAFVLAAKATGNPLRRRDEPWTFRAALDVSAYAEAQTRPSAVVAADELAHSERSAQPLGVRLRLAVGVLRARPEEAAQPVALGARHDVEVQVRHRLAHGVVDRHEGALRAEAVLHRVASRWAAARKPSRSSAGRSGSVSTCSRGTSRTWPLKTGRVSRKATRSSVSRTT